MRENVARRVRNTRLTVSKPLLPLYEAVANAIQAVHEAEREDGQVIIRVERERSLLDDHAPELASVTGFAVEDNGVGFTERNFESFTTADTDHKERIGGKGVGRFLWLVAFSRVEIESEYHENDQFWHRTFGFVSSHEGIINPSLVTIETRAPRTVVRMVQMHTKYHRQCPKSIDVVASQLIEHFLEYFLRPDCPRIELHDPAVRQSIDLNDYFERRIIGKSSQELIEISGIAFDLLHVRLEESHSRAHRVHYCADSRVVRTENLQGKVRDLAPRLIDADGKEFIYQLYVNSELLNSNLNAERTDFSFVEDASSLLADEIDWNKIREGVNGHARRYLDPYTEPIRVKKIERIEAYVAREAPEYRPVLKYASGVIDGIDADVSDQQLDLQLYQGYQALQVQLRDEGSALLRIECSETEWQQHQERVETYFERATDMNMADLSRYVCHRRAILDFVQARISKDSEGRYQQEKLVHQLICPMGVTSNDIGIESHNLWLVDERLVYHSFLASDRPLKSIGVSDESAKEPDVLVFDRPMAFGTGSEMLHDTCHIIEFKRPMRKEYDDHENPFTQIRRYIQDIRSGSALNKNGRTLGVRREAKFFCYVICDLTPKLREWAELVQLQPTADDEGYMGYHKSMDAYFEVMSYTKMISDAQKRNAAFFDKLGLPRRISR